MSLFAAGLLRLRQDDGTSKSPVNVSLETLNPSTYPKPKLKALGSSPYAGVNTWPGGAHRRVGEAAGARASSLGFKGLGLGLTYSLVVPFFG